MFKDSEKFNNNPTEVCYIPDEGSDTSYTREDLFRVCNDFKNSRVLIKEPESLVQILWDLLEGQYPENVLEELEKGEDSLEAYLRLIFQESLR